MHDAVARRHRRRIRVYSARGRDTAPGARHVLEQYENNRVESDHAGSKVDVIATEKADA